MVDSSITDIESLLKSLGKLELSSSFLKEIKSATEHFPFLTTKSFLQRVDWNNINDPLLKQVLPDTLELERNSGYLKDPLDEKKAQPIFGLLYKYYGRALILLTSNCAMNCRFCFRRHYTKKENRELDYHQVDEILIYIENNPTIYEVILSGGDPLTVSEEKLAYIYDKIALISSVKRIRIHTRLPIANPKKITSGLIKMFSRSRLQTVLIIHCNHPNEINDEVNASIKLFLKNNIRVFNQSVLLKGVNDSLETLIQLSEILNDIDVIPYYLHILDKVEGAHHFSLSLKIAKELHDGMRRFLPGYLVPRLIEEIPGQDYKIWR